jgi:anti-anti-sigma factor
VDLSLTAFEKYDIFNLTGEIKVNILPRISPELSNYINANPHRDLILDLAAVNFIDSSVIKLFVNLHKRMEAAKRRLYLLSPSTDVQKMLCDVKLDKVLSLVGTCHDLAQSISSTFFESYLPCTIEENGLHKLCCTCPVCGSTDVRGYLIDVNNYDWKWEERRPFPLACLKSTLTPLDVFGLLPIVCADCFMCSVNVADFHTRADGAEALRSSLSEEAKLLLSKSMKTRKKMMEVDVVMGDNFFSHPRLPVACFNLYLLAESCVRSMASNKASSFYIGLNNFLAAKYAPSDKKDFLIDSCRTWMTQVLGQKTHYNASQLSKAYFVLLISALSLEKVKEAEKVYADYASYLETLPQNIKDCSQGIDAPSFWFSQAQMIWEKEAKNDSEVYVI